jgi:hypothetical protein
MCDAHHLDHLEDGGATTLGNLVQRKAIPSALVRNHWRVVQ